MYQEEFKGPIPNDKKAHYKFKGQLLSGAYLCPKTFPAVPGVLQLSDNESMKFAKSMKLFSSEDSLCPDHGKRLWSQVNDESALGLQSTTQDDGTQNFAAKAPKLSLSGFDEDDAGSDMEVDWFAQLNAAGPQEPPQPQSKAGKKLPAKVKANGSGAQHGSSPGIIKSDKSTAATSGSASTSGSGGGGSLGTTVYRSTQQREINAVNAILMRLEPTINCLKNEEGIRSISVEKILSAQKQLEKKSQPAIVSKLSFRRHAEDQTADEGDLVLSKLKSTEDQLASAEVLARALCAKSAEAGMFWLPTSIEEGIKRCVAASVELADYIWEALLQREIAIQVNLGQPGKIMAVLRMQPSDELYTIGHLKSDRSAAQQRLTMHALKLLFDKGSSEDDAVAFLTIMSDTNNWLLQTTDWGTPVEDLCLAFCNIDKVHSLPEVLPF